jgi:hypothetical protein
MRVPSDHPSRLLTKSAGKADPDDLFDLPPLSAPAPGPAAEARARPADPTDPTEARARRARRRIRSHTEASILEDLAKLDLAGVPTYRIAEHFHRDERTIHRWRKKLRERLGAEVKALNAAEIYGESLLFWNTARALAWQLYSTPNASISDRLRGLLLAMQAQTGLERFLKQIGVTERYKITPILDSVDDPKAKLAKDLAALAESFLSGTVEADNATSSGAHSGGGSKDDHDGDHIQLL